MLKLVVDNQGKNGYDLLAAMDEITTTSCYYAFEVGYRVLNNEDIGGLCSDYWLILNTDDVLKDWELEYVDDEDKYYVVNDGIYFDETDIVYEIHPNDFMEPVLESESTPPRGYLVGIDGGNIVQKNTDTPGMKQLRENMKAFDRRMKGISEERQDNNNRADRNGKGRW